jgi:hypothetical protein
MTPSGASRPRFYYRTNPDNTLDAICAFCYLTAATAANETDLHNKEAAHQCFGDAVITRIREQRNPKAPLVRKKRRWLPLSA